MRRLILLFFLVLLPLQWGWTAAARACLHEEAGASHFGHHQHTHVQAEEEALADGSAPPAALTALSLEEHPDCPGCHGLGAVCTGAILPLRLLFLAAASPQAPGPSLACAPVYDFLRPPQIFL